MKRQFAITILTSCLLLLLSSCGGSDVPKPLDRAIQAAYQMTSAGMLEKSAFYALYPNGTPRQYVSFIFSDIGASEMPPVEGSGELSPEEAEFMPAGIMPVWPAGVGMTHSKPNPEMGMQVVWKWDDEQRKIILEGYVDPNNPPVIVQESDLPIVKPSGLARVAGQSTLETGARGQAFE